MNRILQSILKHAEASPLSPALVLPEKKTSYSDFASLIRRFSSAISLLAESPQVLIDLEKSEYAYAAMIGTWGAGGFYCPLNSDLPYNRKRAIYEKFCPDVIITSKTNAQDIRENDSRDCHVLYIEELAETELAALNEQHETAYVIFTSGSTGEPKGVQIDMKGLEMYITWAVETLGLTNKDVCSQHPNIGFDLSVLDIFAPLTAGAALVPYSKPIDKMAPAFLIQKMGITVWTSVPSVINLISTAGHLTETFMGSVRLLFFCGEPLLEKHLRDIFSGLPHVEVVNAYGPTEATVSCTYLQLTAETYEQHVQKSAAIGESIPHMELQIGQSDSEDEGELIILGDQVATGYWKDPQKTSQHFGTLDGKRYYKTGDWVKKIDGDIYFQNRIDRQCKINGYRIDAEEIDAYICKLGANESYTLKKDNALYSFVAGKVESSDVYETLQKNLPSYYLPKKIIFISSLPRNNNDKIDVIQLEKMITE